MRWLNNFSSVQGFVKLQKPEDLDKFRYAGKITAQCLSMLEKMVEERTSKSLIELDAIAEEFFLDHHTKPVFKGYHGFPATVCISTNKQLVHAIPRDYRLQEGDLVSFDTGCNYKRAVADSAITCIFGKPKEKKHQELISATKEALYAGIKSISMNSRVGAIGNAIFHTARKRGFKVIENYTGHGLSLDQVHSEPTVLNKAEIDSGVRFKPGMVIAIEPLLILGNSTKTEVEEDSWTVVGEDLSAHYEHSIIVNENGPEVITIREDEVI